MRSQPTRIAVIPARYGSTRFPGKPLARLANKPLVVHVLERVRAVSLFDRVCVATDDVRIATVVREAGGEALQTRGTHATGTERVAEVAAGLPESSWIYNIQGDEPLLPSALLREFVQFTESTPAVECTTAAHPSGDPEARSSPHVVKVVLDAAGQALYFSRAPIPHDRAGGGAFLRHIGIYAFRQPALLRFVAFPPGVLERREGLEQLRALEQGMSMAVLVTSHETQGVDTPADLETVASRLQRFIESDVLSNSEP